ncbi:hypothetical protein Bbelb_307240 [Branchiostoma belcheri]|nr:hypothetical protein Bbelb_307240 [Branchiostoma belcheri]
MMLNNNRQYPTCQSTTGNGASKTKQLPNKALLHQVVSATQSWSSQNAALGSLQPYPGTNSTVWRQQQVPQDEQSFPLRKTLSVPAYFRSPTLHTSSYIPNTGKDYKKPSPLLSPLYLYTKAQPQQHQPTPML